MPECDEERHRRHPRQRSPFPERKPDVAAKDDAIELWEQNTETGAERLHGAEIDGW